MIKLNGALLEDLGLGALPPAEANTLLEVLYETLQMRVGMDLARDMTDEQCAEFGEIIGDDDRALVWLESNFPHHREIVQRHFAALCSEISAVADAILAEVETSGIDDSQSGAA